MQHRGPDFQTKFLLIGIRSSKYGFCRLSIQDLDKKANKIFYNDKYCILFNGEIYNVNELKSKYFSNKTFETNTDTELLCLLIKNMILKKLRKLRYFLNCIYKF